MYNNFNELNELKSSPFQTIISKINHDHNFIPNILQLYRKCLNLLKEQGTIWIFSNNIVSNGSLIPLPLILSNKLTKLGFILKNLIVYYNLDYPLNSINLENRYSHIIFLTKDKDNYKFYKDPIREKHIWKNVEWGGGRVSRYHEKGKDPSNFWLKTKDNGKGKIIEHLILNNSEVIDRIIKASTDKDDKVLYLHDKFNKTNYLNDNFTNIELKFEDIKIVRRDKFSKILKTESSKFLEKNPFNSKIYIKTSETMKELSDNSIQTIITSPPYWELRDYEHPDQIGYNSTYSEYLSRLNRVWKECYRVLKNFGSLWININKRVKRGNMILFPYDFYVNIEKIGFKLIDIIIWHKPITVSAYGSKNLGDRYEFILLFSKSSDYKFNLNFNLDKPDYIHLNNKTLPNVWQMFRKIGSIGKEVAVMIKNKKIHHTAIYPIELVRRIILLTTDKGDFILDPFSGSGTTLVVANKLSRNWIGYETNSNYVEIIKFRLKTEGKRIKRIDEFF